MHVEMADPSPSRTLRVYEAMPLAPAWVGLALALILVAIFVVGEFALGRHELLGGPTGVAREARIAILHILLAAYFPTAYVVVLRRTRRTLLELRPALQCTRSDFAKLGDAVGRYRWWGLAATGLAMVLAGVRITIATTAPGVDPWSWRGPEILWHRVLNPVMLWWLGCLTYALIAESQRLYRLAARLAPLDLLDIRPLTPFAQQGLHHALLILGAASIASFLVLEVGFLDLVTGIWIQAAVLATASFVLPVWGVHRRIRAAKRVELDWCRVELQRARTALKRGTSAPDRARVDEVAAYKQLVEGVRDWPFDPSTLARFAFYLFIPIVSWSGGALVERLIDALLE
ncbi:MAG: hypothetical protein JSU66_15335 [Deltaproteobacteria bacterium]|nr:MAG: hypothetical protein JSU66_15335 [Deltaproteobacteria bacterium]